MSTLELIIAAASLGILFSRTTFLEKVKVFLTNKKLTLIVKALDCPYCSSFWSAIVLNTIFFNNVQSLVVNSFISALLGYFVAKE